MMKNMTEWRDIPQEFRDQIYDAALREDELRSHGATRERIKSDYGKRFGAKIARLAMKYKTHPFPLEEPHETQKWAQDFQRRANADNDPDDPEPDWRERQFKDD